MYNVNEELKKDEEKYGIGKDSTGFYKIIEGDNRVRILSRFAPIPEHFKQGTCYGIEKGCKVRDENNNHPQPSVKFLTHVIDRKDGQIKLYKAPYSITKDVGALQAEPDYEFDDMPMPYDLNIKAKKAGTKEVEYTVIASAKRSTLTADEQKALDKQKSPEDIVDAFKEKQMKNDGVAIESTKTNYQSTDRIEYPEGPNGEDIPF
jgi:hypothetical protein